MVLLPLGLNTPSLSLEGSNATLQPSKFNIDRDIPLVGRPRHWATVFLGSGDRCAVHAVALLLPEGILNWIAVPNFLETQP
jgi:hypothetical protein